MILVDSGSIGTFVSDNIVKTLKLPTIPAASTSFKIADGSALVCNEVVLELTCFIQGHTFRSSARVLPLRCFDIILGDDWLEEVSPVWVDFRTKQMKITEKGSRLLLQGVVDNHQSSPAVSQSKLQGLLKNGSIVHSIQLWQADTTLSEGANLQLQHKDVTQFPEQIQTLLNEYKHLFVEPSTLPPKRFANHSIPLIPGAQPVKVRPYKYSPI